MYMGMLYLTLRITWGLPRYNSIIYTIEIFKGWNVILALSLFTVMLCYALLYTILHFNVRFTCVWKYIALFNLHGTAMASGFESGLRPCSTGGLSCPDSYLDRLCLHGAESVMIVWSHVNEALEIKYLNYLGSLTTVASICTHVRTYLVCVCNYFVLT